MGGKYNFGLCHKMKVPKEYHKVEKNNLEDIVLLCYFFHFGESEGTRGEKCSYPAPYSCCRGPMSL
jgi:hypothetical protein